MQESRHWQHFLCFISFTIDVVYLIFFLMPLNFLLMIPLDFYSSDLTLPSFLPIPLYLLMIPLDFFSDSTVLIFPLITLYVLLIPL